MAHSPREVAEQEGITLKALYNILYAMKDCPTKEWRGWRFNKVGKFWECDKRELVTA